ncbi:rCG52889 [Rattus norvegicus]|uniref:RCG52889 n=1 Tax=Rattus norvegicus TaxID=10116 RepID=A6IRI8_RAT|nr:rCG52889 [Rattus norvegicus]
MTLASMRPQSRGLGICGSR